MIAAVVLLIWKPSPFFKRVLDHTAVENTIQQQSNGSLKNVACPSNEEVKTGRTFQCTADGGKKVNVTITDGKTATYNGQPSTNPSTLVTQPRGRSRPGFG